MHIIEVTEPLIETKLVWAKKGKNSITRKYRCSFGKRKGRVVASPMQCSAPIDMKKRFSLKKTRARLGSKMVRKAKKTKRFNPASKRVRALNKQ
jgi:hypothetical protein|tara:strand:+ start:4560 stop:4841 length:282 start_codon:yes stop_codon:yes gene_type:complete